MKTNTAQIVSTIIINWGYWVYNFEKFNKKVHIPQQQLSCFSFNNYLITFEKQKKFKLTPQLNVY
jgi:hypothetical protein